MSYRLLALDLDDTLLNREHRITPATKKAVEAVAERGVRVVIATGRMLISALPYVRELGLKGPVVAYNGAFIKDISSGELIYHQPVKDEAAREIAALAAEKGLQLNVFQNDRLYVAEMNENVRLYEQISGIKAEAVGYLPDFISGGLTKMLVVERDEKKYAPFFALLQQRFADRVTITRSKRFFIEIMAPGVSKEKGLARLAERDGISAEETIAFGDGLNDRGMIVWAGLGIAMEGAPLEVREAADRVAPPHDEDGVARMLREIFALKG